MLESTLKKRAITLFEEPVNRLLNRPLADFFVIWFMKTPITPNTVTVLGMVIGVLAGLMFCAGSFEMMFFGAILAQISVTFDCVDGQLARRKQLSSEFGRILDGVSDYIVSIAFFLGIIAALGNGMSAGIVWHVLRYPLSWNPWIIVLAGFSMILHSASYDFFKIKYFEIVYSGVDCAEKQRKDMLDEFARKDASHGALRNFLHRAYMLYSGGQYRYFASPKFVKSEYSMDERARLFRLLKTIFRFWSWLGPNTHIALLLVGALFGDAVMFALFIVIPMNLYYFILYFYTRRVLLN